MSVIEGQANLIPKKYWEDDLSDYAPEHGVNRFEVLEYWGMCDTEISYRKRCRNT